MIVYTYTEAKQNLASVLEKAKQDGQVKIRSNEGQTFVIRPEPKPDSPLDVESVELGVTTSEIVEFVKEGRETYTHRT